MWGVTNKIFAWCCGEGFGPIVQQLRRTSSLFTFQLHVGDEISGGTCSSLFCQDLHALESDLAVSAKKQDWSCDCGGFMCTHNYMMCNA